MNAINDFFVTHGPVIAAILTGMFTSVTPFIGNQSTTRSQKILKATVATVAVSILIIGYLIVSKYWEPKDEWAKWSENMTRYIDRCKADNLSDAKCVRNALDIYTRHAEMPRASGSDSTASIFYHQVKAGESLVSISTVKGIFNRCFGVNAHTFIGSGSTIPWNINSDYSNADAREFITTNMPEEHDFVWTWQFNRKDIDPAEIRISKLVTDSDTYHPPTDESNKNPLKENVDRILKQMTKITAEPPVIRFQEFSKNYYKNTMGRPEAFKVFTVSLQDVWEMTLDDAMRASGFTRDPRNDMETEVRIFVWLYLPGRSGEAVPATWGNIIKNASNWLEVGINNNPDVLDHCPEPKEASK